MDPGDMGCLDGLTVTFAADAVSIDDITEAESEGRPPVKALPVPFVHQTLITGAFDDGGAVTPSGSIACLLGGMMDAHAPGSYEGPSGDDDENDLLQFPDNSAEEFSDSRSPLPIDAWENSIQGSVRSCPLQEVARLPADCDRTLQIPSREYGEDTYASDHGIIGGTVRIRAVRPLL
jgi:hypothetical protein